MARRLGSLLRIRFKIITLFEHTAKLQKELF